MSGNVWEWTRSLYKPYPYVPSDGREDLKGSGNRVVRGGSFDTGRALVRAAFRFRFVPDAQIDYLGFRVVSSRF
jgi:formylglycine-generating enzyme required for sulfatase activity